MSLGDLFHLLILVCCLLASGASARQPSSSGKPDRTLVTRLDENGGLAECWSALNELKSCTDEIIVYFVNGQTDIDSECCRAIEVITRNCWPTMLTSLGFTSEEGNTLRGYCDASPGPGPAAAAAAPPIADSPVSPTPAV